MNIKCNGIKVHYEIQGKGPDLVLIHGAGNNLNMWYHQIPVFSRKYRVITYDIRGFGNTIGPLDKYSMSILTEDVFQFMKALNISQAYFLGYSMGARIALELAINYQQMVRALVLANSGVGLVSASDRSIKLRHTILELLKNRRGKEAVEIMSSCAFSQDFKLKNPLEFDKYLKVKLQNKFQGLARVMKGLDDSNKIPDTSKVKCPVLLIAGDTDFYIEREKTKVVQARLAKSKLVLFPCGHAAAIELPDEFNRVVIDFLSTIEKTEGKLI